MLVRYRNTNPTPIIAVVMGGEVKVLSNNVT
jgi:hypothetical protein